MGYLQALRAALAAIVLASTVLVPDVVGAGLDDVMFVTAGYLLLSAAVEGVRSAGSGRGLTAVGGMLIMDGLFLAWVTYQTGGTQSPLRFLVYLHLIAVTLLASHRTGLKIALWHSLLFFVVFYAQAARIIAPLEAATETGGGFQKPSFFNVVAFWLVALVTTAFSSINERQLRRNQSDLESLARTAEKLDDSQSPRDVAQALLDGLIDTFEFDRGTVLATEGALDPALLAYKGPGEPAEVKPHLDEAIARAWSERKPQLLKKLNAESDPQLTALLPFAKSLVVAPMFADGSPIGVVALEYASRKQHRIERRTIDMVSQFAAHGALALRNAWLVEEIRRMADTDGLTGIPNRRTFQTMLEKELSRAQRMGDQVTLVMLDVDKFKDLNDKHGHQVGDEVLKHVAASLLENCRDFDTAARYGGEEFAAILPGCSIQESLVAAERLRKGIAAPEGPVPVTASAGVATFPTHAGNVEGLIKAADEALYESKRSGRDRVTRSRRKAPAAKPVAEDVP